MNEAKYPRFISNKPHGKDYYEGESANKIAFALKNHIETVSETNQVITNNDLKLPQIIGLEGTRGSGKSNVIKKLKTESKETFYLFEYDAWSHQEDLQRRSFLEQLTENLIDEKIIFGKTEIKTKNGNSESGEWTDKLKYVLSNKKETLFEKYPRINEGIITSILFAITPILYYLSKKIISQNDPLLPVSIIALLPIIPIFFATILTIKAFINNPKLKIFDYLFAIYQNKTETYLNYETISEDQPSVKEFKAWMNDISSFITVKKQKKIIIVFDNMDRLPSEKVKQLWSIIYTFFTEDGYPNIWAIVPFDKDHLANIYIDQSVNKKELGYIDKTKLFISKTFPITYRINPPVTTDRKKIFFMYYNEAFGNTEDKNKEIIEKLFDFNNEEITPREVINFINELVTIKINCNEISLTSIALYIITKNKPIENRAKFILNRDYLPTPNRIIEDSDILQTEIAALFYGVSIEMAKQFPLAKYIEEALNNGLSINEYSTYSHFDQILKKQIEKINIIHIEDAVNCLSLFNQTSMPIDKLWNTIAKIYINEIVITRLKFEDYQKKLLENVEPKFKKKIIKHLINRYQNIDPRDFNGKEYYHLMKHINDFFSTNNFNIDLISLFDIKEVNPEIFIDYVNTAKNNYLKYKLTCDKSKLNRYLMNKKNVINSISINFISIIQEKDSTYFEEFMLDIEQEFMYYSLSNPVFHPETALWLNHIYNIISNSKPSTHKFSLNQIHQMWSTKNASMPIQIIEDLHTLMLVYDPKNYDFIAKLNNNDIFNGLKLGISKNIEYYKNYDTLMTLAIESKSNMLKNVIIYLTEHTVGISKINLKEILPLYKEISSYFEIPEEVLLKRFANCKFNPEDLNDPTIQETLKRDNITIFKEEKETIILNPQLLQDQLQKTQS